MPATWDGGSANHCLHFPLSRCHYELDDDSDARSDAQPGVERLQVGADRVRGQMELAGHVADPALGADKLGHADLSRRKLKYARELPPLPLGE
jgi:hypothetical protein